MDPRKAGASRGPEPRDQRPRTPPREPRIPVPARASEAWRQVGAQSGTHPVYWLARMVGWVSTNGREWGEADKKAALECGRAAIDTPARHALAERVLERRRAWLGLRQRTARCFRLTARTDAVLWLASAGPLEVGLALHHLYGFPVLPGSALKGLARRVARQVHGDAVAAARYGGQDEGGPVAFLDGLPVGNWAVQLDVMTPHYGGWYRGERPPDDTESPVPIGFLSIGAGSAFEVWLLARHPEDAAHLAGVVEDLRLGLDELGLGAKTAAGYGVFDLQVADALSEIQPPASLRAPSESAETQAVASQIAALRAHEARGRLAAIVRAIERCPAAERGALASRLRARLAELGFRPRDLRDLEQRYPILRPPPA